MATAGFLQQLITNPDKLNKLVNDAKELAYQLGMILHTNETSASSEVGTTPQIFLELFIYVFNMCGGADTVAQRNAT